MAAKKKEIPVVTLADLDLKEEEVAPLLEVTKIESPPQRQAGKIVEEEPAEAAKQMVKFLHDEAKVI
jgi:electron transfer flavoprotein beta subunit